MHRSTVGNLFTKFRGLGILMDVCVDIDEACIGNIRREK